MYLERCRCYIVAHTCLPIDSLTLLGTDSAYILIALPSKLIAMPIIMKSVKFFNNDSKLGGTQTFSAPLFIQELHSLL